MAGEGKAQEGPGLTKQGAPRAPSITPTPQVGHKPDPLPPHPKLSPFWKYKVPTTYTCMQQPSASIGIAKTSPKLCSFWLVLHRTSHTLNLPECCWASGTWCGMKSEMLLALVASHLRSQGPVAGHSSPLCCHHGDQAPVSISVGLLGVTEQTQGGQAGQQQSS